MRRAAIHKIIAARERLDAAETVYSARELESVRAKTYDVMYPELMARRLAPIDTSIHPGVGVVTYKQYNMVGMAVIIANYSDRLPRADVFGKEFSSKCRGIGTSYGYSVQEMREASFTGQPLEQRKANAARRAFEERLDAIVQVGDSSFGLLGLLNQPNASLFTVAPGASALTPWANKTPDEILRDLNGIINGVWTSTKQLWRPNRLLLPPAQFTYIASTPRSATSDTTILEFFILAQKAMGNDVEVLAWYPLEGAGAAGTDRMVAYTASPDHIQIILPMDFTQNAPQWEGLELVTDCDGRCGGVVVYYPLAMAYGDGI